MLLCWLSVSHIPERFAEPFEVLYQKLLQPCRVQMVFVLEDQAEDVGVAAVGADLRGVAESFQAAEVELAFLAEEAAIEAVAFLGSPLCP